MKNNITQIDIKTYQGIIPAMSELIVYEDGDESSMLVLYSFNEVESFNHGFKNPKYGFLSFDNLTKKSQKKSTRITRKSISKAIKEATNVDCEVWGNETGVDGCYHFVFEGWERKYCTTVYVNSLRQFTLEQWLESFKTIYNQGE